MKSLLCLLPLLLFFGCTNSSISKKEVNSALPDSLAYRGMLNDDEKPDLITKLDEHKNFRIYMSRPDDSYEAHPLNLRYCLLDVDSTLDLSTFNVLVLKKNIKLNIKTLPHFAGDRTLNVKYNIEKNQFEVFSYYDTKVFAKDADDPDKPNIIHYNLLVSFPAIQELRASLEGYRYDTWSWYEFNSDRALSDYFNETKNGIIRDYAYDRVGYFLKKHPLDSTNMATYNDIGYYLEKKKQYHAAVFILEKVVEYQPKRMVAYINLGDAYWGLEIEDKATDAYKTYVSMMRETGKQAKIPPYVLQRIAQKPD